MDKIIRNFNLLKFKKTYKTRSEERDIVYNILYNHFTFNFKKENIGKKFRIKGIESLSQTLIFKSLYLCNPMS